MATKSLLSKLKQSVLGGGDESADDIDRQVETAVRAIKRSQDETVDGASVLLGHWGNAGDLVYVMDLEPIYDAIGGHDGLIGQRLEEICENLFAHHVAEGEGHAGVRGDLFLMLFVEPSDFIGFRNAAEIANDIGTQMMGERFKIIDIPDLVVIADAADISDDNGRLDLGKARAVVNQGGMRFTMDEPGPDDPHWLRQRWRKAQSAAKIVNTEWTELHRRKPSDPDWVRERGERRGVVTIDPSRSDRRGGKPRRAVDHETEVDW